jgi:hypothetical protein
VGSPSPEGGNVTFALELGTYPPILPIPAAEVRLSQAAALCEETHGDRGSARDVPRILSKPPGGVDGRQIGSDATYRYRSFGSRDRSSFAGTPTATSRSPKLRTTTAPAPTTV